LEYAGAWLKVNGEAIYGTRPWVQYGEGQDVRFTRTKDGQHLYAICLKWPGKQLVLKSVRARKGSEIHLLGVQEPLAWRNDRQLGLVVELPEILQAESNRPCRQAFAFKIQGEPARQ
jgi:alpha-L-fucosidase